MWTRKSSNLLLLLRDRVQNLQLLGRKPILESILVCMHAQVWGCKKLSKEVSATGFRSWFDLGRFA